MPNLAGAGQLSGHRNREEGGLRTVGPAGLPRSLPSCLLLGFVSLERPSCVWSRRGGGQALD